MPSGKPRPVTETLRRGGHKRHDPHQLAGGSLVPAIPFGGPTPNTMVFAKRQSVGAALRTDRAVGADLLRASLPADSFAMSFSLTREEEVCSKLTALCFELPRPYVGERT